MIKTQISSQRLLPAIHGLRGVAAITIVLFHLHHLTQLALPQPIGFIATHFGLAVPLFFVLSAFALCYSASGSLARSSWVRDYLIKRFFRIAPLFYFTLGTWTMIFWLRNATPDTSTILLNILMVFNFVPGKHESIVAAGWTIGVEMLFYLLLPLLLMTLRTLGQTILFCIFASVASATVHSQLDAAGGILQQYAYFSFLSSLGIFALGVVAFKLHQTGWMADERARRRIVIASISSALLVFVPLVTPMTASLSGVSWRPDVTLWAIGFASLIVWQSLSPSFILSAAFFEFLGERSFGIYLLHPLAIFALNPVNKVLYSACEAVIGAWAFVVCSLFTCAVVVLLSMFSYRLIEVPAINLGRYLIARGHAPCLESGTTGCKS